jgi:hypothetical protein
MGYINFSSNKTTTYTLIRAAKQKGTQNECLLVASEVISNNAS